FPSSMWPTRLPTAAAPSKQAGRAVVATTEAAAASPGTERDSALTKDGEGAEDGEKDEKSESEDGEREHEEEEEKDAEKEKNRATADSEVHNSTESSVAVASPNRTAEEEGNKTVSGEEPNQNVAPMAGGAEKESFAKANTQPQPLPSTQVPPAFTNELYLGKIPRPETTRKPPPKMDRFPEEYPSDNKFITINPGE
ncbi:PTPRG phosphatase, partial [Chaetorhynchus papuensis]|nr:PTPRG phosphatase [Chaetorhynchus papuensis]